MIAVAAAVVLTCLAALAAGVRDLAAGEPGHGAVWLAVATVALVAMLAPERTAD